MKTKLDHMLALTTTGKNEMKILMVRLERTGETKILDELKLTK